MTRTRKTYSRHHDIPDRTLRLAYTRHITWCVIYQVYIEICMRCRTSGHIPGIYHEYPTATDSRWPTVTPDSEPGSPGLRVSGRGWQLRPAARALKLKGHWSSPAPRQLEPLNGRRGPGVWWPGHSGCRAGHSVTAGPAT